MIQLSGFVSGPHFLSIEFSEIEFLLVGLGFGPFLVVDGFGLCQVAGQLAQPIFFEFEFFLDCDCVYADPEGFVVG